MVMVTPVPLVTREALQAFTQQLAERFAPEKVILYSVGEAFGYLCHESNVHHEH